MVDKADSEDFARLAGPDGGGGHRAHAVHVFTTTGAGIAHIVAFQDPALFAAFGLPLTYPGAAAQAPVASR